MVRGTLGRVRAAWPGALIVVPAVIIPLAGVSSLHDTLHLVAALPRRVAVGSLLVAGGAALALAPHLLHLDRLAAEQLEGFSRKLLATLDVRELTRVITREAGLLVGAATSGSRRAIWAALDSCSSCPRGHTP